MKAAVLTEKGFILKEMEKPVIKDKEVLIRVKAVGICGTDLAIYKRTYKISLPRILGHEFTGVVDAVGENVTSVSIGERVTSEINITCGKCYYCTHGMPTHCMNRTAIGISRDGAMAEYIAVPEENVHRLPKNIDFDEGTFIEPLAASIQTFKMSPLKKSDTVAIYGSGKMALLILQVAKALGASKVIVIGRNKKKLELAKKLGADKIIDVTYEDPVNAIKEETYGVGADMVVEATGNPEVLKNAIEMTRSRGTLALKSTHGISSPLNVTEIVVRELRIQGSRCGEFPPAIKLLKENKIQVKPLISEIYPLNRITDAFNAALDSRTIKVIVHP